MLHTSAKSRVGCDVQGNINITQDVVRAISILHGRPCAYVLHTKHVKTLLLCLKNDLAIQQFFFLCGL